MIIVLMGLLLLQSPLFCQEPESLQRERIGAKLAVTTTILEQKTCLDDSGSDSLGRTIRAVRSDLVLRTTFTNVGHYPIILSKSSGTISGHKVSHDKATDHPKAYEQNVTDFIITLADPSNPEKGDTPSNAFVILKPGESFKGRSQRRLFFDYPDPYNHLSATEHFIRFYIWADNGALPSDTNLEVLRARWLTHGYLWIESVRSEPMSIRLPAATGLRECPPTGLDQ